MQPVQDWTGRLAVHFDDIESGNRQVIEADHVLGCDGANSVVRQAIGSRMIDLGFEQRWLVIDVETDADIHQWDGVYQVCDRRRAATFMRIGQRRYRWEFRLLDGERLSDFESMGDIHQLIAPWTTGTPPEQLRLIRTADYVFRARVVDRWRRGGVFLLGDAATGAPLRSSAKAWAPACVMPTTSPAQASSIALSKGASSTATSSVSCTRAR